MFKMDFIRRRISSLKPDSLKKFLTLFFLYFIQAFPYGFQAGCLPIILRRSGLSFTSLGALKFLFLPWVFKPLIASRVERKISFWVYGTIAGLGICCFVSAAFVSIHELSKLSVALLIFNALCAILDIGVDCLAVKFIDENELGIANTVQIVGYKIGSALAGSLLLLANENLGWGPMFYSLGLFYFLALATIYKLHLLFNNENVSPSPYRGLFSFYVELKTIFIPGTWWMIGFVLFYKLNDKSAGLIPLILSDIGLSTEKIALGEGIARIFSIMGSAYSGYLLTCDQKPFNIIKRNCFQQTIIVAVEYFIVAYFERNGSSIESLRDYLALLSFSLESYFLFCGGMITTACFTAMMSLSKKVPNLNLQGTHFSTLCTFEILGKLLFSSVIGLVSDNMGLTFTYGLFFVLSALNVPLARCAPIQFLL